MPAHRTRPDDAAPPAYVFPPPPPASVPVVGSAVRLPVHRIYCVGRNYAAHAREMGFSGREAPFFFMKPADAVPTQEPGGHCLLPYPPQTSELHHEVELVVAIGRGGSAIPVAQAMEHVWGYGVGLDLTRRDLQAQMKQQGRPWCIAKGFDASAPVGPLTPVAEAGPMDEAAIWLRVNGEERQRSDLGHMIWSVAEIISHLSMAWTLQPGDLVFTGTPEGVGAVQRGDLLEAGVDGLAPLRVQVA